MFHLKLISIINYLKNTFNFKRIDSKNNKSYKNLPVRLIIINHN